MSVSIAAVGLGLLGQMECDYYESFDDVDLVAGVDVSGDARAEFESSFDVPTYENMETLLTAHENDLDAISIVTPHTLHYEHAMAALEADLHVFVEKPLTTDVETARELVETAQRRDRVLQVGFQRHFDPLFIELRRLINEGDIGTPHTVSAALGQKWITEHEGSWRVVPSLSGGGQLFDSGTHLVDSMLWVLDARATTVAGVLDKQGHDVDVNSALAATLDRDGDQITATVCVSGAGTDVVPHEGLTIWGTNGHVELSDGTLTVTTSELTRTIEVDDDKRDFDSLTDQKLRNFVDAIVGDAESVVTGEYGLSVTAFLESAYKAAESGQRVTVTDAAPMEAQ